MTTGVWALETIRAIQRCGIEVVVLSPTPWIPQCLAVTRNLQGWSQVPYEERIKEVPVFYPKCPHYPHRLVARFLYNYAPALDSSAIWPWCRKTVASILHSYPFQAVHANFIFPSGFIGLQIKRTYGIPLVVHERSPQRLKAARDHSKRRKTYAMVIREADVVLTLNQQMAVLLKDMASNSNCTSATDSQSLETPAKPLVKAKVRLIPSAGDVAHAADFIRPKPARYSRKRIILSVGALTERKGHAVLIKALSSLRNEEGFADIHCIIIGSGVRYQSLQRLVRELSLEEVVELYGQRSHAEVLETMSWCDVFVLPSWDEAFGTVYAEAMTFAKPVIACQGQGVAEYLRDGVHGLLVEPRSADSLTEALAKVLRDENWSLSLGANARNLADGKLNYEWIARKIIESYEDIV